MDDLALYEELVTDPEAMAELGGPLPHEGVPAKVTSLVNDTRAGEIWYRVILPEPGGPGAGTVCIWQQEEAGAPANEIGWMVLPRFQGRGLASEAVRVILDEARAKARWDVIHAYPGVTNAPSNRICEKSGFSRLDEVQIEYAGRPLRCNHWVIDVRERAVGR